MNPLTGSLLKYDEPVLVTESTDRKSPTQPANSAPVPPPPEPKSATTDSTKRKTQEILNAILPPWEWTEGNQLWVQQVSSAPCSREDVIHLREQLDTKLQERQARESGICPVRSELYSQCFDELIRQESVLCAERGQLLARVRDEIQTLTFFCKENAESGVAFGRRKSLQVEQKAADMENRISELEAENKDLKKQLIEQKRKCVALEKSEKELRQTEEEMGSNEIERLRRGTEQLKTYMEMINTPKE